MKQFFKQVSFHINQLNIMRTENDEQEQMFRTFFRSVEMFK
jgi:hypothetical protein